MVDYDDDDDGAADPERAPRGRGGGGVARREMERVARGAWRGVAQAAREAAAAGPGGRGAAARPRVLVVSAERDRARRSTKLVDAVLQGSGAQVLTYTLPEAVAAGAEPQLSSVLVGLDTLRRTGADLVLAHGNASTIHVAKVLSMLAFEMPRSETEVASYMIPIIDGRAPRKGSSKPASIPDIRLPLVALPTLPCGGVESSPVVALSDYDKERRLVLSAPELTPTHVLVDPEAIALDVTEAETESKTGIFDARLLHFMAGREFACALESSAAGSSDSLAYLQDAVSAWNEEDAAQITDVLCTQSIRMGKVFKSAQPIAPHEILAAALRDIAPISFEEACGSLLEPSLRLLSEAHEGQPMAAEVGDIISSLPKPQGLLAQGVIFDKEEHLKAAAQAVDAATKGRLHCDRVLRVYEDAL